MTQTNTLALNANWTDAPVTLTNSGNNSMLWAQSSNCLNGWYDGTYWYPYYRPIVKTVEVEVWRPIKLTMAEIEGLRVAAKKDKALKATLEKFTNHIEVIVDFGKAE